MKRKQKVNTLELADLQGDEPRTEEKPHKNRERGRCESEGGEVEQP
jgi:hypothetical protein